MALIAERYSPMPLADLLSSAAEGRLPDRAVAVTFDDGYLDNLEVASPILCEEGIPATFFINSGHLAEARESTSDTLTRILFTDRHLARSLRLDFEDGHLERSIRSRVDCYQVLLEVHRRQLTMTDEQRRTLLDRLQAWSGLTLAPRPSHRLMTSDEIVQLAKRPGHEIGAHGVHHLQLPAHAEETQRRELADDRAALERLIERPVLCFAYPYGDCDLATVMIAEDVGYDVACTVDPDAVTRDGDPLRSPRLEIGREDAWTLDFRLSRALTVPLRPLARRRAREDERSSHYSWLGGYRLFSRS